MIVLVTMIANCGSRVLVCLAICLLSLTLLILSSCTMVTFFHADPQNWIEANFFTYGAEGFFRGICAVCICFSSGEALSMFIEESKVPRRRATPLISSINVLLIFIYFSVFLLFSVSVNVSSLSSQSLLPEFFTTMNVPAAKYMLSVGSVCSLFGSLLCLTVPGSRALSSLALDGLIPSPKSPRFSLFICMIVAALSLFIRSSVVFSMLLFLAPFRCIIIISMTILQHYCKEPIGIPHETSHYRSMMTSSCELHGSIAESTDSESSTLFIANAARVAEEKLQKKLEEAMNGSMEKEPVMAKSVSQYHTMDVRRPSNHSHEHEHNCIAEACDATSDDDSAHLFSNDPMRIIVPSIASSINPQAKGVASECQRAICLLFLFILSSALLSQIIFNQNGITVTHKGGFSTVGLRFG
ncbi:hypothetical protein WR25_15220 [Diploscapter pachys]|uniref:Amino acid permease/ SLC12A domain-containing protein n=1 Tax=Diploscapter pachys TaxID=2018661 RepID=A0A2A2LV84_9BILA|nr:hypothetical protein WR25_15220 [Diploscapter pachys]